MDSFIGAKIKALRIAKGMTQEELGAKIGVQRAAINKYEKGIVTNIKRSRQVELARALGADPAELFFSDAVDHESANNTSNRIPVTGMVQDGLPINEYNQLSDAGKKRADAYIRKLLDIEKADAELNEPIQEQAVDINREIEMAKKRALEISEEFMNAQRDHSLK